MSERTRFQELMTTKWYKIQENGSVIMLLMTLTFTIMLHSEITILDESLENTSLELKITLQITFQDGWELELMKPSSNI